MLAVTVTPINLDHRWSIQYAYSTWNNLLTTSSSEILNRVHVKSMFASQNKEIQGELSSHHQSLQHAVGWYRSWLSESIGPQRLLFSYWPYWCVINSNNPTEHLIGSGPFIKLRHWSLLPDNLVSDSSIEFPDDFKWGPADTLQLVQINQCAASFRWNYL